MPQMDKSDKFIKRWRNRVYRALRWSEKHTKTDMVYLGKGMSWLGLGQVFASTSAFVLALAFANLLPPHIYGNYKFILSIAGILSVATLKGLKTSLVKSVAQGYEKTLEETTRTRLRWSILGVAAAIIGASYYFFRGNEILGYSMLIVAAFGPLMDAYTTGSSFLQGKKLFGISTKYFIYSQTTSTIALITVLFLTDSLFLILLAYFVPWLIWRYLIYKIAKERYLSNEKADPESVRYGKHLSFINIIPTVAAHIDKILLFHYLGAVQVAVYSFAIAIPAQMGGLFSNINYLSIPRFANRKLTDVRNTILRKNLWLLSAVTLVFVIYYFLAPFIYDLLFPQYVDSTRFSQIYMIALIGTLALMPNSALASQQKTSTILKLKLSSSVFQVLLVFLLILFYGIWGAVLATILSKVLNVILSHYYLFKETGGSTS